MKILLTGATGLLGKATIKQLVTQHEVIALVHHSNTDTPFDTIVADLSQPLPYQKLPSQVDAVIHLAQSPYYRDFPAQAPHVFQINTAATLHLLDYAVKAQAKSFFYASSGSVYEPYQQVLTETAALQPTSFYAASKLAAEQLMQAYQSQLNICAFRLFFLYGSQQANNLIPTLINRIRQQEKILVDGKENGLIFTPTFVDDVAKLIDLAITESWSGLYNVASPQATNIVELAQLIGSLLDEPVLLQRTGKATAAKIMPQLDKLRSIYPSMQFTSLNAGLKSLLHEQTAPI